MRGGGLPCGGCQRFESAYLQPVNLADTMTRIAPNFSDSAVGSMISHSCILIFSFMYENPFTLGWHILRKWRGSNEERLTVDT